eukprot:2404453-Pyramimonas_sp.AAC.1
MGAPRGCTAGLPTTLRSDSIGPDSPENGRSAARSGADSGKLQNLASTGSAAYTFDNMFQRTGPP